MKVGSVMNFSNLFVPVHTMKCIGLFKRFDSSTCVVITGTGILNSGTQSPLKMLSDSILYHSNFKKFPVSTLLFYHAHNCERVHHVLGCLNLPIPFH